MALYGSQLLGPGGMDSFFNSFSPYTKTETSPKSWQDPNLITYKPQTYQMYKAPPEYSLSQLMSIEPLIRQFGSSQGYGYILGIGDPGSADNEATWLKGLYDMAKTPFSGVKASAPMAGPVVRPDRIPERRINMNDADRVLSDEQKQGILANRNRNLVRASSPMPSVIGSLKQ